MERIITMASNEGDVVMDPFVGGGTTVAVADKLNRQWVGIDQSVQAVKVTEYRLYALQGKVEGKMANMFAQDFYVQLHKYDYDTLRYKDAFEFESFMVTQMGGTPNTKQRGDLGMDGKHPNGAPIQVKRSDNIGRNVVDNFFSAIQRFDKKLFERKKADKQATGYIVAFSFGKGAIEEVARLKKEGVIIELVKVEDILPIAKKPTLTLDLKSGDTNDKKGLREVEFTAHGKSDAGIEFYAWDFDYDGKSFKAEVLIDKAGHQTVKLKPGKHTIAVKVVDNDGLEGIEVITLKVNGGVVKI